MYHLSPLITSGTELGDYNNWNFFMELTDYLRKQLLPEFNVVIQQDNDSRCSVASSLPWYCF